MVCGAGVASGQTYPSKSIRIVTGGAGGGTDFVARLIAQELSGRWSQQVVVDNRPSGVIPGDIVSKAAPDGYTLLVDGATFWTEPLIETTPYDPVKDFSPVSLAVSSPLVLVVHQSVAVNSVKELIAVAKAKPGMLNYGAGGIGSSNQLAAELFKAMAGINVVGINYKGAGPAVSAVIGGEVQLMFPAVAAVMPHLKSSRLRALAVTSAEPSALAPELPTIASTGLPGYEAIAPSAVFAPAKTPDVIVNRLNREIGQLLRSARVKEKFLNAGVEAIGSSPEQLASKMQSEMAKWSKVIRDARIGAK